MLPGLEGGDGKILGQSTKFAYRQHFVKEIIGHELHANDTAASLQPPSTLSVAPLRVTASYVGIAHALCDALAPKPANYEPAGGLNGGVTTRVCSIQRTDVCAPSLSSSSLALKTTNP